MNKDNTLETILTEIGSNPIPQDVDQLAEGIVDEFRRSQSGRLDAASPASEIPSTAVQQEELKPSDSRMCAQETSRPAARLVPDVPTDLADGDPRGSHPIEEPSSRRHSPWRFVTMFQRRTVRWSAVAAVIVLTFAGVGSWLNLGDGRSGVVWADVVEQIRTVTTISYEWTHTAVTHPGSDSEETHILQRGRSYLRDPGKRRSEVLDDNGEIGQVVISLTSGNSRSTMVYDPAEGKWEKSTISGVAVQEGEVHRAALTWVLLEEATSEQAVKLGEKAVDGRPAAGFRATLPLENMSGLPPLIMTFEVWVDQVTAIPMQVVAIFQQDRGGQEGVFDRLVMQNIQWNQPLDDALFQLPEGARTDELEFGPVRFSGAQLKDGVTLWLGPRGGTPVVTEKDISQVAYGQTSVERVDGDETYRTVVYFDVNQDGQARLRKHTREHPNEKLLIDFNGEIIYEPTIRSEIGSRFVIVLCESEMIDEHDLSLKEFEGKYLRE